jgi:phosphatidylglycerophosphate synthase
MDGVKVPPSFFGKAKAVVQYLAIFMALLRTADQYGGLYPDQWVMLLAVAVTVMSGYGYFRAFAQVLRAARARA